MLGGPGPFATCTALRAEFQVFSFKCSVRKAPSGGRADASRSRTPVESPMRHSPRRARLGETSPHHSYRFPPLNSQLSASARFAPLRLGHTVLDQLLFLATTLGIFINARIGRSLMPG